MTADQDRMALAVEVAILAAERAITRLLHDYGALLDYGAKADWVDLFTPDGRYELHYRPGMTPRNYGRPRMEGNHALHEGHDMLAAFVADHSFVPQQFHKHFVAGLRIDLDGMPPTAASVSSFFLRVDQREEGARILASGRYLDDVVRCADGRWRFARRVAEIEIQG